MKGLRVEKPGWFSLIQDQGRIGCQRLGITTGGALDEHAARWANHLLENPHDAALLEVTVGNCCLFSELDTTIAVTGADLQLQINGVHCQHWQTHRVSVGDRIYFEHAAHTGSGVIAYLAVAGGFQMPLIFGSASTVVREGLGGLSGLPLQENDLLPCRMDLTRQIQMSRVPWEFIPDYQQALNLHVVVRGDPELFGEALIERFFGSEYRISRQINRMGYRLEGPAIAPEQGSILSQGVPYGAIQVPADGQPIILLKDRQTIGGYPVLGTVLSLDAYRLAQYPSGTPVRFTPISLLKAQQQVRQFLSYFS
ncbi:MAG: biotin-dependent carboxyltransferase family protein [Amphritea sp.]